MKTAIIFMMCMIICAIVLPCNASNITKVSTISLAKYLSPQNPDEQNADNNPLPIHNKYHDTDSVLTREIRYTQHGKHLKSATIIENNLATDTVSVNVTTPGTFLTVLGSNRLNVVNLKVTGSLNYSDLYNINNKLANLKSLDLWDVTLPNNTIADYTFKNNKTIQSVTMPKLLTSTGVGTFSGCYNLQLVINSELCTKIGSYCFSDCGLTGVIIGPNITTIGNNAFYNCYSLEEIIFSDKLVSIGNSAFAYCAFASLNLPATLTTLESNAFTNCNKLKVVKIKNTTPPNIDQWTTIFTDPGKKTLIVPSGCKNSYKVANVWKDFGTIEDISSSIVAMNVNTYGGLKSVLLNGKNTLNAITELTLSGKLNADDIYLVRDTIPNLEKLDLSGAQFENNKLPDMALMGDEGFLEVFSTTLKTIILPNSLTSIGYAAFGHCMKLTSLTLPESLKEIGTAAFWNCYMLSINVPATNKNYRIVDDVLFSYDLKTLVFYPYNKAGTSYTIPEGTTTIGGAAFGVNYTLYTVTFPSTLVTIKENAFDRIKYVGDIDLSKCNNLASVGNNAFDMGIFLYCTRYVKLPENLKQIGNYSFTNASRLNLPKSIVSLGQAAINGCDTLTIPDELPFLKTIGASAFGWCTSMKSLPKMISLDTIGNNAFNGCLNLTSIEIPSSVRFIGKGICTRCSKLTSISVNSNNKYYSSNNGVLFNYDQTRLIQYPPAKSSTNYIIPQTVTSIGGDAFYDALNLVSVILPNNLSVIENSAFYSNILTSIEIPASVVKMGDGAFTGCFKLKNVLCRATVPPVNYEVGKPFFRSDIENTVLTVPLGSKSKYANDKQWNLFSSIIEDDYSASIKMTTMSKGDFTFTVKGVDKNTKISINWGYGKKVNYTLDTISKELKSPVILSNDTSTIWIYGDGITYLNVENKNLVSLDVKQSKNLKYLYCSLNQIPITKLPKNSNQYLKYQYAPQQQVDINDSIQVVKIKDYTTDRSFNFSNYLMAINEADSAVITNYKWITKSGKVLVENVDYKNFSGVFNFLKEQKDSVYCELYNSAFPLFSGNNILRSKLSKVIIYPNIVMKTILRGQFTFAAESSYGTDTIYVDWGDTIKHSYLIHDTYIDYISSSFDLKNDTTVIKIYGNKCGYLNLDNKQLVSLDITKETTSLFQLNCNNNNLTKLDLGETDLWYLYCNYNQLTELIFPNLFKIYCDGNKLTSLDFSRFSYYYSIIRELSCANNQLDSLNLSDAISLEYLNCVGNKLTSLKISTSANIDYLNCSNNRLTFKTLPRMTKQIETYSYYQQNPIEIPEKISTGTILDLSNQLWATDKEGDLQKTTYRWFDNRDYVSDVSEYVSSGDGTFVFSKSPSFKIFCSMTNPAFPELYLKTSPTSIVASTSTPKQLTEYYSKIYSSGNRVIINLSNLMQNTEVWVYDLTGKLIATRQIQSLQTAIQINEKGIYIVRLYEGNNVQTKKVTIL